LYFQNYFLFHHYLVNLFCVYSLPLLAGENSYVINSGMSVWGIDWCPNIPEVDDYHYLIVGGFLGIPDEHHRVGEKQVGQTGCLQLYSFPKCMDDDVASQK
jgi:hypothetical protein